jgi:hypothetical protein
MHANVAEAVPARAMQAIIEEAAEAMPGPTDQPTVTPSAARR